MAKINKEKEALLTQERLKEVLEYNYDNGNLVWITKPSRHNSVKVGQVAGYVSNHGYVVITLDGARYQAHRLVWKYVNGEFPTGEGKPFIDHINGDRADNRIENLRLSSQAENHRNRGMSSGNTSGVSGVCRVWSKSISKGNPITYWYWRASWRDEHGGLKQKSFNIETYGEEVAKQMAISHRVEQIQLLAVRHNITYTYRHGKSFAGLHI